MEESIWKPIPDYEGIYEYDQHGNVKSLSRLLRYKDTGYRTSVDKILKPYKRPNGYLNFALSKNWVKKTIKQR